jgi:hypothetical protein
VKEILGYKSNTSNPSLFYARDTDASHFFKGFMLAARAANFGFRWKTGTGTKVRFWENNWLGPSSLAVQFWELYVIVNEKAGTVADLWDGVELKCTFRRTIDNRLSRMWLEVLQLAYHFLFKRGGCPYLEI